MSDDRKTVFFVPPKRRGEAEQSTRATRTRQESLSYRPVSRPTPTVAAQMATKRLAL